MSVTQVATLGRWPRSKALDNRSLFSLFTTYWLFHTPYPITHFWAISFPNWENYLLSVCVLALAKYRPQ